VQSTCLICFTAFINSMQLTDIKLLSSSTTYYSLIFMQLFIAGHYYIQHTHSTKQRQFVVFRHLKIGFVHCQWNNCKTRKLHGGCVAHSMLHQREPI